MFQDIQNIKRAFKNYIYLRVKECFVREKEFIKYCNSKVKTEQDYYDYLFTTFFFNCAKFQIRDNDSREMHFIYEQPWACSLDLWNFVDELFQWDIKSWLFKWSFEYWFELNDCLYNFNSIAFNSIVKCALKDFIKDNDLVTTSPKLSFNTTWWRYYHALIFDKNKPHKNILYTDIVKYEHEIIVSQHSLQVFVWFALWLDTLKNKYQEIYKRFIQDYWLFIYLYAKEFLWIYWKIKKHDYDWWIFDTTKEIYEKILKDFDYKWNKLNYEKIFEYKFNSMKYDYSKLEKEYKWNFSNKLLNQENKEKIKKKFFLSFDSRFSQKYAEARNVYWLMKYINDIFVKEILDVNDYDPQFKIYSLEQLKFYFDILNEILITDNSQMNLKFRKDYFTNYIYAVYQNTRQQWIYEFDNWQKFNKTFAQILNWIFFHYFCFDNTYDIKNFFFSKSISFEEQIKFVTDNEKYFKDFFKWIIQKFFWYEKYVEEYIDTFNKDKTVINEIDKLLDTKSDKNVFNKLNMRFILKHAIKIKSSYFEHNIWKLVKLDEMLIRYWDLIDKKYLLNKNFRFQDLWWYLTTEFRNISSWRYQEHPHLDLYTQINNHLDLERYFYKYYENYFYQNNIIKAYLNLYTVESLFEELNSVWIKNKFEKLCLKHIWLIKKWILESSKIENKEFHEDIEKSKIKFKYIDKSIYNIYEKQIETITKLENIYDSLYQRLTNCLNNVI